MIQEKGTLKCKTTSQDETDCQIDEKNQVSRFHTRQALSILVVFAVLIAIFLILLAKQYHFAQRHEQEILLRHFGEHAAYLDNLLGMVTDHVNGMRMVAEEDLLQTRIAKVWNQPLEFGCLADVAGQNRYNLDRFKSPIIREMIGNLTGDGSIQNRDQNFYREMHMALALNPLFQSAAESIKNAAWIYFTSHNNFINIYPWVPSSEFKFSNELYTHEFYTLGLIENNPERKMFWTKVYVDEYGKGLMTTCAAPVDDGKRFVGTVAIDLTVDFLNTVMQNFNTRKGVVMFLINDRDQLLAHPTLITSDVKKTKTLSETLPKELQSSIDQIRRIPDKVITRLDSFDIMVSHLGRAPWRIFYLKPADSFWSSFIKQMGIGPLTVLAILLILVILVLVFTEKQFILPSAKFVNYIMTRSKGASVKRDYDIPYVWQPWFETIESVFGENEKLTQKLWAQNEDLEQRVRRRTSELEEEIEERKKAEEEGQRLIKELKKALAEVKKLQGFIPICSSCKKIRNDEGYWLQIEKYIQDRSDAQFSHGICPACMEKLYPDFKPEGSL